MNPPPQGWGIEQLALGSPLAPDVARYARVGLAVAPESVEPDRPIRVLSDGRRPHVYLVSFTVDSRKQVEELKEGRTPSDL
jgi:hypothetical protein